jgi:hypothetical protein
VIPKIIPDISLWKNVFQGADGVREIAGRLLEVQHELLRSHRFRLLPRARVRALRRTIELLREKAADSLAGCPFLVFAVENVVPPASPIKISVSAIGLRT